MFFITLGFPVVSLIMCPLIHRAEDFRHKNAIWFKHFTQVVAGCNDSDKLIFALRFKQS